MERRKIQCIIRYTVFQIDCLIRVALYRAAVSISLVGRKHKQVYSPRATKQAHPIIDSIKRSQTISLS